MSMRALLNLFLLMELSHQWQVMSDPSFPTLPTPDVLGNDTLPLEWCGEEPPNKLGPCQGDCDRDTDCLPGLTCFKRKKNQLISIPGCEGSPPTTPFPSCPIATPSPTLSPTTSSPTSSLTTTPTPKPTPAEVLEERCKIIKLCLFVPKGADAKKQRMLTALERASDIWKQEDCRISFEPCEKNGNRVHEFDLADVKINVNGEETSVGELMVKGQLRLEGDNVVDPNFVTLKLTIDDVRKAFEDYTRKSRKICPDEKGCKKLRVYGFPWVRLTQKTGAQAVGSFKRFATVLNCDSNRAGSFLAQEIGHNLSLTHQKTPRSAREIRFDNLMLRELAPPGTGLAFFLRMYDLNARQCITARDYVCDPPNNNRKLCFRTLPLGQKCPETRWDRIRKDVDDARKRHRRNLRNLQPQIDEATKEEQAAIERLEDELEELRNSPELEAAEERLRQAERARRRHRNNYVNEAEQYRNLHIRFIINRGNKTGQNRPAHERFLRLQRQFKVIVDCIKEQIQMDQGGGRVDDEDAFPFRPTTEERLIECLEIEARKAGQLDPDLRNRESFYTATDFDLTEAIMKAQVDRQPTTDKMAEIEEVKRMIEEIERRVKQEENKRFRKELRNLIEEFRKRTMGITR